LISLAHITLFFIPGWFLLAGSNILTSLFGISCEHIFKFGTAFFIIFSERHDVQRYILDAQALIKHLFELLIAIKDLSRDLVSYHFLTAFPLDTIDDSDGLVGLVQESEKNLFCFGVSMGHNEPFFSHFLVTSKKEGVKSYILDTV
jgi:hypothetical protein